MIYLYLLLFFLLIFLVVYLTVSYLEQENLDKFADDIIKKKADEECKKFNKNVFYKPKEEDITDL